MVTPLIQTLVSHTCFIFATRLYSGIFITTAHLISRCSKNGASSGDSQPGDNGTITSGKAILGVSFVALSLHSNGGFWLFLEDMIFSNLWSFEGCSSCSRETTAFAERQGLMTCWGRHLISYGGLDNSK